MHGWLTAMSRGGQALVFAALAAVTQPAFAQAPGRPGAAAPAPKNEIVNIDAGKTGEQLFKANCVTCHKSAAGLSKAGGLFGVQSFLREHYTASRESAAILGAYLMSIDAAPPPRAVRQRANPEARRTSKRSDEAKPADAKPADANPADAKPAEAKAQESPRPPASVPESKPAEAPAAVKPAAPAEPKPADVPKPE